MVHSFSIVARNNGNIHVLFFEDNKLRTIVFVRETKAFDDFYNMVIDNEMSTKDRIIEMKKKYIFKANKNNKSIFRPIEKSLTLKSI